MQSLRLKAEHDRTHYPWPCQADPNRTVVCFDDDVFTGKGGVYTMHTGICKVGIRIPDDHLEPWPTEPVLVMSSL